MEHVEEDEEPMGPPEDDPIVGSSAVGPELPKGSVPLAFEARGVRVGQDRAGVGETVQQTDLPVDAVLTRLGQGVDGVVDRFVAL